MVASTALALRSLLVLPSLSSVSLDDFLAEPCLANSHFGSYGGQRVFLPELTCAVDAISAFGIESGHVGLVPEGVTELLWVQEMAVDEGVFAGTAASGATVRGDAAWQVVDNGLKDMLEEMALSEGADGSQHGQTVITSERGAGLGVELLYRTPTASLFAILDPSSSFTPKPFAIDHLLPPLYKAYALPTTPSPLIPVPPDSIARVRVLLSQLKYSKTVAKLVANISVPQMHEDITYLTGEREDSPIWSRHSFHPDTIKAAGWLVSEIEGTGASCELKPFLPGFAPNVVCQYNATTDTSALVLFSAHYDSRGSFGSTRAPGGDDDGSGTTAILSIARTIGRTGITFHSNVQLVLFAGEEQGLYGSRGYSRELLEKEANITLMVQADMLAYHVPGEPSQLGLPDRIGTPEVAQLVSNISAMYSPELKVGFTAACCSDHQSFFENGFASTQVFERAGPIADPMYHNSGDLSDREGYDLEQVKSIAKVQFATLLHAAGFDLPKKK